jgi:phosphoadenosine phosphosulfate reductase
LSKDERTLALAEANAQLEAQTAEERVAWRWKICRVSMLSSSFGIQAAVSLHLVNQVRPNIPVILTDTGYLFPETYQFIDELTEKLRPESADLPCAAKPCLAGSTLRQAVGR